MYVASAKGRAPASVSRVRLLALARWGLALSIFTVGWCWSQDAHAYAWMIRHGYTKCSTCHMDPSGGETLTHMGRVQGQQLMAWPWDDNGPELNDRAKLLNGQNEPDNIRLGGSLRALGIYSFGEVETNPRIIPLMQGDLYAAADYGWLRAGASVGITKVSESSTHSRAALVTKGEGLGLLSRSHWIGADLSESVLIRAGRLNLPFGVRLPEHTLWTRDATKTDRESDQQHGVAVSVSEGPWRGEFMAVLGNFQVAGDNYRERGYSGYLEYVLAPRLAVGVSSMTLQSKAGPYFNPTGRKTVRAAHGVTGRYAFNDELVFLAEVDVLKSSEHKVGYTGFVQADYEHWQGLHFMGTLEFLDQGALASSPSTSPGSGEVLKGLWLSANWFFYDHLDFRFDTVIRQELPTEMYGQLHYYF